MDPVERLVGRRREIGLDAGDLLGRQHQRAVLDVPPFLLDHARVRGGIAHGGPDAEIQRPALNDIWTRAKLDEVLPGGMTRAELILRYTLTHSHCHTIIVGTCNLAHLTTNLAAAAKGPLPSGLYEQRLLVHGRVRDAHLFALRCRQGWAGEIALSEAVADLGGPKFAKFRPVSSFFHG